MPSVASAGRTTFVVVLVVAAVACGISAVGQQVVDEAPNPEAGTSSSSGGSSGGTNDGSLPDAGIDAPADAPVDAPIDAPIDAPPDGTTGCPAGCTGCDAGTCIISGVQNVVCPPGVARCEVSCTSQSHCDTVKCGDAGVCRITCNGASVCNASDLECGTSACQIRCIGQDACNSTTMEADLAASLCLFCNGNPGCNSLTCSPAITCTRQSMGSNNTYGGCVMCTSGTCP